MPYEIEYIDKNVACIKCNTKFLNNQRECVHKLSCKPKTQKLFLNNIDSKDNEKVQPVAKSVNYLVNLVDDLHDDVVDIKKIQNEKLKNMKNGDKVVGSTNNTHHFLI